ncbi:predicted protein, partial [Postia placenta Mad-698-R]
IYERAAGDKVLPSDLRPPPVLKKTLNYLFHDLLMRGGFRDTYDFIRDRSRAVRSEFTMQHNKGGDPQSPLAMECHERCARYHILALHLERDNPRFSVALEEQQLMYTLQSLKEYYDDQRGIYQSSEELEMRVYHRLIHIRDQSERLLHIPSKIINHPVFRYTTQFRQIVQAKSAPISKASRLVVDAEAMEIFGRLAAVLREQGNVVMIYLVACILERLFGPDTIDEIEAIRGDLTIPEIIDGVSRPSAEQVSGAPAAVVTPVAMSGVTPASDDVATLNGGAETSASSVHTAANGAQPAPSGSISSSSLFAHSAAPSASSLGNAPSNVPSAPAPKPVTSAFGNLQSTPNAFGSS